MKKILCEAEEETKSIAKVLRHTNFSVSYEPQLVGAAGSPVSSRICFGRFGPIAVGQGQGWI